MSHWTLKYLWKPSQIFVAISRFMAPIGSHWVALPAVELNALCRKTPRPHNWLLYGLFPAPWKHTFSSEPPFSEDPDDPKYLNHIFFDWMLKQKCGQICTFCSCQTSPSPPSLSKTCLSIISKPVTYTCWLFLQTTYCFSFFMCASTSASARLLQQCCGLKVLPW